MKPYVSFRKLDVYVKAYALSLHIHRLSGHFPKHEQYSLADQFRRSSRSICATIAEGFGKQNYSKPEFKRFVSMAIGSTAESMVWNDYAYDLGYTTLSDHDAIDSDLVSIDKMLRSLHTKIQPSS